MTAQIFQLVGIAFITAVAAILVKSTKPELAVVITIAGSIILLLFVEFSAGILSDFGQNSLADKLIFCGKILILVLAVPILESVLSLVGELLGLIA